MASEASTLEQGGQRFPETHAIPFREPQRGLVRAVERGKGDIRKGRLLRFVVLRNTSNIGQRGLGSRARRARDSGDPERQRSTPRAGAYPREKPKRVLPNSPEGQRGPRKFILDILVLENTGAPGLGFLSLKKGFCEIPATRRGTFAAHIEG